MNNEVNKLKEILKLDTDLQTTHLAAPAGVVGIRRDAVRAGRHRQRHPLSSEPGLVAIGLTQVADHVQPERLAVLRGPIEFDPRGISARCRAA